jgi:alcohol dehydrogenase (NADP+)
MPDHGITLKLQDFASNGCYIGTNHIGEYSEENQTTEWLVLTPLGLKGNRSEMEAMLELASKQNIKSWVETIQISEEGCKEAVERVKNSDRVRYRFTLIGYDKVFGKRT